MQINKRYVSLNTNANQIHDHARIFISTSFFGFLDNQTPNEEIQGKNKK